MKPIFSKIRVLGTAALALFLTASCSDILDEQPRSSYDPTFFKTEKGVEGGVTSMYAHLRYIYGQAYYYNSCLTGTDEATWGWSADGNFKDADVRSRQPDCHDLPFRRLVGNRFLEHQHR